MVNRLFVCGRTDGRTDPYRRSMRASGSSAPAAMSSRRGGKASAAMPCEPTSSSSQPATRAMGMRGSAWVPRGRPTCTTRPPTAARDLDKSMEPIQ
eukprot:422971-Pyramimonas_sp.AAC.4